MSGKKKITEESNAYKKAADKQGVSSKEGEILAKNLRQRYYSNYGAKPCIFLHMDIFIRNRNLHKGASLSKT